jgi:very-short-patch-repair endonuclease
MPRVARSTPKIKHRAAALREAPTAAEARLWARLRLSQVSGIRFRRQYAIGRYIADFCSPSARLIIELDGSQHLTQAEQDSERSDFLRSRGFRVLRFWNSDVLNDINGVIRAIQQVIEEQ